MKELCLDISIALLALLFAIFTFSTVGFLFNLSITPIYPILASIIAFLFLFVRLKSKNTPINKIFYIFSAIILFLIASGFIQYKSTDFSFDGCWYHQASIINLKWGWNPVYEKIYDFSKSQPFSFNASFTFMEGYMKGYEVLAANIYSLIGKIEVIKILKCILALISFLYVFYSLSSFEKLSKPVCIILSFLFVYNPVCIYQFFTNYNDDVVYYLFLIFLFSFINYAKNIDLKDNFSMMFMSSVLLSCTKLNGFYFVLIMYFVWAVFYFSKPLAKNVLFSFILIIIFTVNPIITNIKYGNSPFYPIIKGSSSGSLESYIVDVPVDFENKNHFEKIFISLFSYPLLDSVLFEHPKHYELKIPFSGYKGEVFFRSDMRLSGFGHFFAEVVILSLILLPFVRFREKSDKKIFLCAFLSVFLTVILMPLAWWARYVPQTWILPLLVSLMYLLESSKKYYAYIVLILIFINSFIINIQNWSVQVRNNKHRELIMRLEPYPMTETLPVKRLEIENAAK